ncbi:MAG: hypothetical protein KAT88_03560 [Spirochaetes bacterium]|nr:hypothetical protein [Spirochaetota bacterium]
MEILINEEKIEFELETEKNVGEIIKGLESWIVENDNVIESISIDSVTVPFDYNCSEFSRSISLVKELKVITLTQIELAVNTIVSLGEYIIRILSEYDDSDSLTYYDSILEGMKLIYSGIVDSLRILNVNSIVIVNRKGITLKDVLLEMNEFILIYEKKYIDPEGIKKLKDLLKNMLYFIAIVFKWAVIKNILFFKDWDKTKTSSFLGEIFQDLSYVCSSSFQKFDSISKDLQIGRDRKALGDLCYITELLDEVISILKITKIMYTIDFKSMLISDKSIDDLFYEITDRLKSVESAFKNGDMITVGDVLEYEIKPLFKQIPELFEKMDNFIK